MNNRVIVYVVNLGIKTTGKAHVSLQQCAATFVGEKIVFFTNCNRYYKL